MSVFEWDDDILLEAYKGLLRRRKVANSREILQEIEDRLLLIRTEIDARPHLTLPNTADKLVAYTAKQLESRHPAIGYTFKLLTPTALATRLKRKRVLHFLSRLLILHFKHIQKNINQLQILITLPQNFYKLESVNYQFPLSKTFVHLDKTMANGIKLFKSTGKDDTVQLQVISKEAHAGLDTIIKYIEMMEELTDFWNLILEDDEGLEILSNDFYEQIIADCLKGYQIVVTLRVLT